MLFDLIIAETHYYLEEAKLALEAIKRAGLPSVVTLSLPASGKLRDDYGIAEACKILEDEGADVGDELLPRAVHSAVSRLGD